MADAQATTKTITQASTKDGGGAGLVIVRADSAYYGHDVIASARRGGTKFSVTARMNATVLKAISRIDEPAWTPIQYRTRSRTSRDTD